MQDEYEVARLFTDGEFDRELSRTFFLTDSSSVRLHISPPALAGLLTDAETGLPRKISLSFGLVRPIFKLLAAMRILRNTPLDPFQFTADRRRSRALLSQYEGDIAIVLDEISDNHVSYNTSRRDAAARLMELVATVRGFGHVRERSEQEYFRLRQTVLKNLGKSVDASQILKSERVCS